jgi:hypothetical protein
MGLGKPQRKDLKAFSLKIKTKDLPKPEFVVSERRGEKFEELPEREYSVSGNLIGVEPKETVWQGKTIKSVNVTLTDGDQIYFVTVPYSNLGRGLMNSLLGLKAFGEVEISLYQTKPKTDGAKTYPAVSLRQGGEIVRWRYSMDELPKPQEITFKGETMRDFTAVEAFLAEQLKELNKVIKATAPVQSNEAVAAPAGPADDELDAPF